MTDVAWNYTLFCYGSFAVIKYSLDRNEGAVDLFEVKGLLSGGCGVCIGSTTTLMLMATTTSTTITAAWSE